MKMDEQNKVGLREKKREDVCPSQKGKLDLESVRAQIEQAADEYRERLAMDQRACESHRRSTRSAAR